MQLKANALRVFGIAVEGTAGTEGESAQGEREGEEEEGEEDGEQEEEATADGGVKCAGGGAGTARASSVPGSPSSSGVGKKKFKSDSKKSVAEGEGEEGIDALGRALGASTLDAGQEMDEGIEGKDGKGEEERFYTCQKCRSKLFPQASVLIHGLGEQPLLLSIINHYHAVYNHPPVNTQTVNNHIVSTHLLLQPSQSFLPPPFTHALCQQEELEQCSK